MCRVRHDQLRHWYRVIWDYTRRQVEQFMRSHTSTGREIYEITHVDRSEIWTTTSTRRQVRNINYNVDTSTGSKYKLQCRHVDRFEIWTTMSTRRQVRNINYNWCRQVQNINYNVDTSAGSKYKLILMSTRRQVRNINYNWCRHVDRFEI